MHSGLASWITVVAAACLALCGLGIATAQPGDAEDGVPSNNALADEAFNRGDYAAAVDLYHAAVADGVDHSLLRFRLGYSLHVTGRIEEALPNHLRGASITLPALRIDALYNAACAHALLGKQDDALRYLRHAIDAGFRDTDQVARDSDLDPLRQDPRFKDMLAGIGVLPTLFHQLDFLLGQWEITLDDGRVLRYTIERAHERSAAITYASFQPSGAAWAGMFIPEPVNRAWEWTYCDGMGTTYRFTGSAADGVVTFLGRQHDIGGLGVHVRITFSPRADGTVTERGETSTDGQTWKMHHEEVMRRAEPTGP